MPNHTINNITAPEAVIDAMLDEKGQFDFNKIVEEKGDPDTDPDYDWHNWRCRHWGTKWNAYQTDRTGDTEVTFLTAWSPPIPALQALAKKYNCLITNEFFDEFDGSWNRIQVG